MTSLSSDGRLMDHRTRGAPRAGVLLVLWLAALPGVARALDKRAPLGAAHVQGGAPDARALSAHAPVRGARPRQVPKGPMRHPFQQKIPRGEMLFNFRNASIRSVVRTVAAITGRNFLVDPRVRGKVTIVSATPVSVKAAYAVFLAALKAQGFSAVAGPGGVVTVLPAANARQAAPISSVWPHGGDRLVTQIMPIEAGSAAQVMPLLRPLMSSAGIISDYAPANTLIVTDDADNIRRLLRIVSGLTARMRAPVAIVPLQHASAAGIAKLLVRLGEARMPAVSGGLAGAYSPATVVPDRRTNSLLVRATSAARRRFIEALIRRLDVRGAGAGTTHVVYLKNARADTIAKILRGLVRAQARATGPMPPTITEGLVPPAGARASRPRAQTSLVQADPSINALIVSAPNAAYDSLRAVIAKLDIPRPQVFVRALIAEVTVDDSAELGVQWAGAAPAGGGAVGGITNFPLTGSGLVATAESPSGLATEAGLALGFLSGTTTLADGQTAIGLSAFARALQSVSGVNVLSTPDILTLDNTEAKIMVGQNVPFITGSYSTAGMTGMAAVNPFQTVERKNVGLTLKIKPQITAGNNIKMRIYENVSSIAPSLSGAVDLITNKRELKTTVIVANGRTIVLGGLISDEIENDWQGVPLLDEIPGIGDLFRYRERVRKKTDLMVFLKPVIVRTSAQSRRFTASRYAMMQAEEHAARLSRSMILPNYHGPALTPRTGIGGGGVPGMRLQGPARE